MGFLSWILLGLVAGAIAKFLMPGKNRGGCLSTTILGIVGGLLGGFIGTRLGWGTVDQFDFRSLLLAVAGAGILLLLGRLFLKKSD